VIPTPIAANPGDDLDRGLTVLRLAPNVHPFVPAGQPGVTGDAFHPSPADEEEAKELGQPIRLSVWETQLTTTAQARLIHGRLDTIAVTLGVADVLDIREKMAVALLRVVWDPLPPERGSGANGHCGIEGLDRPPGTPRPVYRAIWDELARKAKPLAE
jgi:hypothetical protein